MKKMKKLASVLLALVMTLSLAVTAFASTVTPSITIENASKGVRYNAYKLFDAEVSAEGGIAYYYKQDGQIVTDPEDITDATIKAMFAGEYAVFTMNAIGQISKKEGVLESVVTTKVADWASDQEIATATGVGEGGPLTITLADYGYYAVLSQQSNAAFSVTSTNPTVTIHDKTQVPVPEIPNTAKTITSTGTSYALGDTISYKLEIPTTNWVGSGKDAKRVTVYTLTDTATKDYLKIDTASVNVTVGGNTPNPAATVTRDANGVMTISVPWGTADTEGASGTNYYGNGAKIVVTYDATVIGTGTGNNSLKVSYNETEINGTSTTTVYNTQVAVYKYHMVPDTDSQEEGATKRAPLANAEFVLKNSEGKFYQYVAATETAPATIKWVENQADATVRTSGENGNLDANFIGLEVGNYTLVEVKAPAGYNMAADKTIEITAENVTNEIAVTAEVENITGATLPSTGGIGTTIFYVGGGILIAAAGILLITKKRMSAAE